MKKKQTRKREAQNTGNKPAPVTSSAALRDSTKLKNSLGIFIAIFAFILYAQSINHDYTLDDHKVVDKNSLTTSGISGIPTLLKTDYWYGSGSEELRGPVYRPTSLIIYAIIWEFSPDSPHAYHFVNVVLFAFTCLLLFFLLCKLFTKQSVLLPFICSLLFAAHPIHTEVVNNIKSLDEILCFLFSIVSLLFFWRYISTKSNRSLVLAGVCFFLALLSKETAISFLLIIPLTIFFFSDYFKKMINPVSVLLVGITGFWIVLRTIIFKDLNQNVVTETSELNNTLYAAPDFISKYATAFYILLRYIGLLIFPHPLSCDYNFAQIKIQTLNDPAAVLGIIIYAAMGIYSLYNLRRKSIVVYGILFYLLSLAPVSNIFFLGGSSMAERFMYIPSFGFCLILAYFLIKFTKIETIKLVVNDLSKFFLSYKTVFLVVFGITILYSIKSFSRNKDWKDTLTIFSRDIKASKNSATANELLGNSLLLRGAVSTNKKDQLDTFNLAKTYLKRALEIAPGFFYASSNLGYIYLIENKADSAFLYLNEGLKYGPDDVQLNLYLGAALLTLKKFDEAIKVYNHLVSINPRSEEAYSNLASAYLGKGDPVNGLIYYSKVLELNPNNAAAYFHSGMILRSKGDTQKANEYINRAMALGFKPN